MWLTQLLWAKILDDKGTVVTLQLVMHIICRELSGKATQNKWYFYLNILGGGAGS